MESTELSSATISNCQQVMGMDNQAGNQMYTQNVLQMTQVLDVLPDGSIGVDGSGVIQLDTGQDITGLHTDASSMLNPATIQYVVIQRHSDAYGDMFPVDNSCTVEQPAELHPLPQQSQTKGADSFKCGLCEQICESVLQFLQHKATHIGRGLGLGCEICRLSFSRQLAIMDHYRRKHKIFFVENQKPEAELKSRQLSKAAHRKPKHLRKEKSEIENTEPSHKAPGEITLKTENVSSDIPVVNNVDSMGLEANLGVLKSILGTEKNEECALAKEQENVDPLVETSTDIKFSSHDPENQILIREAPEHQILENTQGSAEDKEELENAILNASENSDSVQKVKYINQLSVSDKSSVIINDIQGIITIDNKKFDQQMLDKNSLCSNSIEEHSKLSCHGEEEDDSLIDNHQPLIDSHQHVIDSHHNVIDTHQQAIDSQIDSVGNAMSDQTKTVFVMVDSTNELQRVKIDSANCSMKSLLKPKPNVFVNESDIPPSNLENEKENTTVPPLEKENPDSKANLENTEMDLSHRYGGRRKRKKSFSQVDQNSLLSSELNMPDFHFISAIEENHKSSIRGGRYIFKCLYCDIKVRWRSTMCRHMRDKHADVLKVGPYFCFVPPAPAADGHTVMKMSEYIKLERGRQTQKRIRGIETQDLPGDFPCDKCGKLFHRLRYLRKHQILHKVEKNVLCTICVKSFKTIANLNQHMKTHRDRNAYKCSECDFESTINIAIHTHRQLHSKGCVLCDICGCAYNDKSTLTKHKSVHDSSRPFACRFPGCTWRFRTKNQCSAHFRAHTTKGKFECHICGYAFRQKHHLQRHERKVHNIVPEKRPAYTYLDPVEMEFNENDMGDDINTSNENNLMDQSDAQDVNENGNMIVHSENKVHSNVHEAEDNFDFATALQCGQLVIATEDGGTIPVSYEMSDIDMNGEYHTLLQDSDGQHLDAHTILIPQTVGSHIVYQHEEVTETIITDDGTCNT